MESRVRKTEKHNIEFFKNINRNTEGKVILEEIMPWEFSKMMKDMNFQAQEIQKNSKTFIFFSKLISYSNIY